jgi:hypothetical protein
MQSIVLNKVLAGQMTGQEAAELLRLSLRHTRQLIAGYQQAGAPVLAHRNSKGGRDRAKELLSKSGIVVTHDLRMCRFVDWVIQIVDGQINRSTSDCKELETMANVEFPV